MRCPHCGTACRWEFKIADVWVRQDAGAPTMGYDLAYDHCPECQKLVVLLRHGRLWSHGDIGDKTYEMAEVRSTEVIYPKAATRELPPEVPDPYRTDFAEAEAVLSLSPKASAAISRRLLQDVLREELKIRRVTLAQEIEAFLASPGVPSHLTEAIDAVRNVGNFAAHAERDHAGEVVDVEPGEADWLLELLEGPFDHVFVQPRRLKSRKASLNQKLNSVGKPSIKEKKP